MVRGLFEKSGTMVNALAYNPDFRKGQRYIFNNFQQYQVVLFSKALQFRRSSFRKTLTAHICQFFCHILKCNGVSWYWSATSVYSYHTGKTTVAWNQTIIEPRTIDCAMPCLAPPWLQEGQRVIPTGWKYVTSISPIKIQLLHLNTNISQLITLVIRSHYYSKYFLPGRVVVSSRRCSNISALYVLENLVLPWYFKCDIENTIIHLYHHIHSLSMKDSANWAISVPYS